MVSFAPVSQQILPPLRILPHRKNPQSARADTAPFADFVLWLRLKLGFSVVPSLLFSQYQRSNYFQYHRVISSQYHRGIFVPSIIEAFVPSIIDNLAMRTGLGLGFSVKTRDIALLSNFWVGMGGGQYPPRGSIHLEVMLAGQYARGAGRGQYPVWQRFVRAIPDMRGATTHIFCYRFFIPPFLYRLSVTLLYPLSSTFLQYLFFYW